MATNTAQVVPAARQDPRQVTNTLKKTVNFNDPGIASGVAFDNSFPIGAFILGTYVAIVTAFNGGSTNVLTVGTNSTTYNNLVASTDVDETAVATTQVLRGIGPTIAAAADITPFAKYTQTGGAATTGQAIIVILFEGGWST